MTTNNVYVAWDEASGLYYHGSHHHRPILKKGVKAYGRLSDLTKSLSYCKVNLIKDVVIYTYELTDPKNVGKFCLK